MNDINAVTLIGRLTRDAELKYTNSGTAICKFSIAVNKSKKVGEAWEDEAHFFDVVLWGRQGEAVQKYLEKGKQVGVQGELTQQRWEKDGQNRSRVEVKAYNVQLLGNAKKSEGKYDNYADDPAIAKPPEYSGSEQFEDDIPF